MNATVAQRAPWQPCGSPGWHLQQLKRAFAILLGKMLQNAPASPEDQEIPYLKAQHVQWDGVRLSDLPTMWASTADMETLCVQVDDLLVCEGGDVGRAAVISETPPPRTIIQNALHLVRRRVGGEPRFLAYVLRHAATQGWFDVLCNRSTISHFTVGKFGEMWTWLPSVPAQRAIADYLDRETARIDALIAAKERLLGLLAEKRRALITHAVTRGLDPHAPLRDSGIPWLGEIPAHWETVALRFLVDFTSGATPDTGRTDYWDGVIPWVSPKDMKRDEIVDAQDHVSELALTAGALRLIEAGAVLIVVRGMILAHSFPAAVTTSHVTINQDMKALRCRGEVAPHYLRDFFRGHEKHIVSLADSSAHGTRKLETEVLGRLEIGLPPPIEQRAIAAHIKHATSRLDALREATEQTISLLKERRSALIAEAVTGQLDVGAAV